ncbi:MAG: hypothetical protein MK161_12415 [Pirellulales bacterium]|jgi:uncharacterized repeat protein (TIGR04138 family)|nr:hypothetical protein [Pirellulales bacterium]
MVDPQHPIADLLARDRRYKFDAYAFVFDALRYAQEKLEMGSDDLSADKEGDPHDKPEQHITGQELCEAIRCYALEQYGLMAKGVLNYWGIRSTGDIGEIVFNLIEIGQMRKTPEDRREDFDDVFDFVEGLQDSFQIGLPDSSGERSS